MIGSGVRVRSATANNDCSQNDPKMGSSRVTSAAPRNADELGGIITVPRRAAREQRLLLSNQTKGAEVAEKNHAVG